MIRTQEDCPYAKVRLVDTKNDKEKYAELSFEVTAVVHPNGRCCRAIIPEHFSNWTLGGLMVVQVILEDTAPVCRGVSSVPFRQRVFQCVSQKRV